MTIRVLKMHLQEGKITRSSYTKQLCDLFEENEITEREYQDALHFDPADNPLSERKTPKEREREMRRTEALEMLGIIKPEEKRRILDTAYSKKVAEGLEMIGIKQVENCGKY